MADKRRGAGPARDRARDILIEGYDGAVFGQGRLAEMQAERPLSDADAGLCAELVLGTFRHRITAEHLAAHFYRGRWAGLDEAVRVVLALGVYQLCWLDRVPDHAVVDAAVYQVRSRGRYTAAMVNAILRAVAESRGPIEPRPDAIPPRRYLAVDRHRGRMFDCDVFPDPARRPLDHLVAVTSHPMYLVERWHRRFKPTQCRRVLDAGQRRPALVLRPNPIRTTAEDLAERLTQAGLQPRLMDGSVVLDEGSNVAELEVFAEGLCQPQDSTAQVALRLSPPEPGSFVLDLCAGNGTKSTQAAEMMGNSGRAIVTDVADERLARVPAAAVRLGLSIIECVPASELALALAAGGKKPDLILVDAPCSNTGVLARRPEARYRASKKGLDELTAIQRGILEQASALAGPRSRLTYSTCSIEREENEDQAAWFVASRSGWRMMAEKFTLPDDDRDGGYAVVFEQLDKA